MCTKNPGGLWNAFQTVKKISSAEVENKGGAFVTWDGTSSLANVSHAPFPPDLVILGPQMDGIFLWTA